MILTNRSLDASLFMEGAMSITVPLEGFGGGVPLNFAVKAYATEAALLAAAPKENTTGIITTTAISSWALIATEPAEPVGGMVWINVGGNSAINFNVLKRNTIQVYPLSAKQYVDGAWVDVAAMSYQNGAWVPWVKYLYNAGNECTETTGGLQGNAQKQASSYTGKAPTITKGTTSFSASLSYAGDYTSGSVTFANPINLDNVNTIHFKVTKINKSGDGTQSAWVGTSITGAFNSCSKATKALAVSDDLQLDVSSLSGDLYVGIKMTATASGDKAHCTIESIWLD